MGKQEEASRPIDEGSADALSVLDGLLKEHATSELWNDWATVQFERGKYGEAKRGYSLSLAMDPANHQAELNLGLLLWNSGDSVESRLWIEKALPFQPPETQSTVRLLLERQSCQALPDPLRRPSPSTDLSDPGLSGPARILVVHETFPHHKTVALDRLLIQVLTGLCELGHAVTFIARDAVNRSLYEKALLKLGIQCYAGDVPRMQQLGAEAEPSGWSLEKVLSENKFEIALLSQTFNAGVSITEQYLDDIRRCSPGTRIAILADALSGRTLRRQAEVTGKIEDLEWANNLSQREIEGFERADSVLLANAFDVNPLGRAHPNWNIARMTHTGYTKGAEKKGTHDVILFAGDLENQGCAEGFEWFMKCVWPALERADSLHLSLALDNVPTALKPLLAGRNCSGVRDVFRLLPSTRLFISPLRFSVQSEIILSMVANGIPGVVTSAGLEASGLDEGMGVLRADTPEEFAEIILRLNADQPFRDVLAEKGRRHIDLEGSPVAQRRQLVAFLDQLRRINAKPLVDRPFSIWLINEYYKELLAQKSGSDLRFAQLDCYVKYCSQLLYDHRLQEALEQVRHVFGRMRGTIARTGFLSGILTLLASAYRKLGENPLADRCAEVARLCASQQATADSTAARPLLRRNADTPILSLIIPTFNRLPILKKCLAALEVQTLPATDFEVIVIDDGSSDGTEEELRSYRPGFRLRYLHQKNSGTGAARRNGVGHAAGEYLLLMNDDTILQRDALAEHLQAHQKYGQGRWAVLGNFQYYPAEARKRALSHFFSIEPFMFPQVAMDEGCPYGYSHFITCNLSIRRSAVLEAGSFDSIYKLSEDTELGLRLYEMGYRVLYHPRAHAWHDHLPYPVCNLIRRARVYGADYFYMFQKHPRVMSDWTLPVKLVAMDAPNAYRILDYLDRNRAEVKDLVASLERCEHVDFAAILDTSPQSAPMVMELFKRALPTVHWFYLFETMFETMQKNLGLNRVIPSRDLKPAYAGKGKSHARSNH
jgi:glycosyltransferase involved in cell wall biosynthesis